MSDPTMCEKCGVRPVARGESTSAKAAAKKELCHTCYRPKKKGGRSVGARSGGTAAGAREFGKARAEALADQDGTERTEERFLATMFYVLLGMPPERIVRRLRGAADYVERAFCKKGRRGR